MVVGGGASFPLILAFFDPRLPSLGTQRPLERVFVIAVAAVIWRGGTKERGESNHDLSPHHRSDFLTQETAAALWVEPGSGA